MMADVEQGILDHEHKDQDDNSLSSSAVPPEVLKKTRAVLLSCTKGVLLRSFSKDYFSLAGESFPWRRLGYSSMISMLQAMPEAVHFEYSNKDGDYKLHGVGDSKSFFMPSWVLKTQEKIHRQRSLSPHSHTLSSPPPSSQSRSAERHINGGVACDDGDLAEQLSYNARGLVTLYIKWNGNKQAKSLTHVNTILTTHLSTVEEPAEVFIDGNKDNFSGIAFVRFDSKEKAIRVLRQLNGSAYLGFKFRMSPAKDKNKRHVSGQRSSKNDSRRQNGPTRSPHYHHHQRSDSSSSNASLHSIECTSPLSQSKYPPTNGSCYDRGPRSHDSHVIKGNGMPTFNVQNRFRHLINELDPNGNESDSDDASIMDFFESEEVMDLVPSRSQIVSTQQSRFAHDMSVQNMSSESIKLSHDQSCDVSHDQSQGITLKGDFGNSRKKLLSSVSELDNFCWDVAPSVPSDGPAPQDQSHDFCWDVAPVALSVPSPPNEFGLVRVHVSEVVSPDLLWLQLSSYLEGDVKLISTIISEHRLQPVNKVSVGDYCCIRHSTSDGRGSEETVVYERALVEGIRESQIKILSQATLSLIDTGVKRENVPLDDLLELPSEAHPSILQPLATPCSLHGIVSVNEQEGWFPLDIQLLWKHLHHKQVYAKEVLSPGVAGSVPQSTKHKTTAVELYFDPSGSVSFVDVLVQEGMRMDYSLPNNSHLQASNDKSDDFEESHDLSEGGHVTKNTRKNLLDLPTISSSALHHGDNDRCNFESSESRLTDLEDSLFQLKTKRPIEDDSSDDEVYGHVTSSKFMIGQRNNGLYMSTSCCYSEAKRDSQTPRNYWEEFQKLCEEVL